MDVVAFGLLAWFGLSVPVALAAGTALRARSRQLAVVPVEPGRRAEG